jgi:hypothetical protein
VGRRFYGSKDQKYLLGFLFVFELLWGVLGSEKSSELRQPSLGVVLVF